MESRVAKAWSRWIDPNGEQSGKGMVKMDRSEWRAEWQRHGQDG